MARKRHFASIARGFLCFCLMAHHRSTLMRTYPAACCPPGRGIVVCYLYPRAMPSVTQSSAFQAPERIWRPSVVVKNPEDECLSLFIALRWMLRPERVMVWLTENIQACLRIFWQLQHQWFVRDILHLPQGVFYVFVLWPPQDMNPSYPSNPR